MRGMILSAFLAIGAVSSFDVAPAAARTYPVCLTGREIGYPGDCSFSNFEQCRASASGRNAACTVNPVVAFAQQRGVGIYRNDPYSQPRARGNRRNSYDGSGSY